MKRRTALILVLLAGVGALSQSQSLSQPQPSKTAANDQQKVHPPTLLWKTFPLRQQTAPRGESRSRSQLRDRHDGPRNWLWILAGTTLALSATAAAVASLLSHSRHRGGHMDKFRLTHGDRNAKNDSQERKDSPAEQVHATAARVVSYLSTAQDPPLDSGSSLPTGEESDFDRLGDHVSSVLSAAKEAAVRIQEEARQDSERVREQAQKEATARAEAAREDADATRAEAERLRSDAEDWTKQARTAAENYAADRRSEAEAEAREIASAAERQASFSKDAELRQQALKMDISLAEDRLHQLATGLHDLAGRLDKLLSTPFEGQEGDLAAGDNDSLIDALEPSRETEEATT
jgi:hypothetical protein